jgi:hypothetical protein
LLARIAKGFVSKMPIEPVAEGEEPTYGICLKIRSKRSEQFKANSSSSINGLNVAGCWLVGKTKPTGFCDSPRASE